jgi:hypothetical protein
MRKSRVALIVLGLAFLLALAPWLLRDRPATAAIEDCATQQCAYLPLMAKPFPTETPEPTNTPEPTATSEPTNTPVVIPPPSGVCATNAPAPAAGAQAWMTITSPARYSDTTLCARLIVDGHVVSGATASGLAHYKSTNTALGPATTGADGVAHMTFSIGGATAGYTVVVDATVGGQYAQTSFTPH